jgi:hypothetical protein
LGEPSPPKRTFEKKLKLKTSLSDEEIVISGNVKIGRFKTNEVVLAE